LHAIASFMLCTGLNLAAHLASSHHWSQSVKDTIWPDSCRNG
jgi:hypothetical protein